MRQLRWLQNINPYIKIIQMYKQLILSPKKLFLIDAAGALLTAFFLFAILRPFDQYFGMPVSVLNLLALVALLYLIYSFSCFLFAGDKWRIFIKIIIVANLLYCILTLAFVVHYSAQLTLLGITYFLMEALLIFVLIYIEINSLAQAKG